MKKLYSCSLLLAFFLTPHLVHAALALPEDSVSHTHPKESLNEQQKEQFLRFVISNNLEEVKKMLNLFEVTLNESNFVREPEYSDMTPLGVASKKHLPEMVELLLRHGADPNALNGFKRSALHCLILGKSVSQGAAYKPLNIVFFIRGWLEIKPEREIPEASLVIIDQYYRCPSWDTLDLLLKTAKVDTQDSGGATPLQRAVERGLPWIAKLLLNSGADPRATDLTGWTALHYAYVKNRPYGLPSEEVRKVIIQMLESQYPDLKSQGSDGGWTPQELRNGCVKAIEPSTTLHAWISSKNVCVKGTSRASFSSCSVLHHLLKNSKNIDEKDFEGATPLHRAVERGLLEVVELLLNRGADPVRQITLAGQLFTMHT